MDNFLEIFLITVAIAIVLNVIFKKFEIPTIIGYIAAGEIISEIYHLSGKGEITHIAEFGIVFLMFTIGLEFSFKHLMAMKQEVFFKRLFTDAYLWLCFYATCYRNFRTWR